jgi:hypothetical protein
VPGIFGSNRTIYLKSSDGRRRGRLPAWVWVLAAGAALGAAGMLAWQQQGPKRLTREESAVFHARAERAQSELAQTTRDLTDARRQLEAAKTEGARALADLKTARASVETLRQDLVLLGEALPPDPRGGEVGVRSARFVEENGELAWSALLTREPGATRPVRGGIEITLYGTNAEGRAEMVRAEPAPLVFEGVFLKSQGQLAVKSGFTARQAMIRVLEAGSGKVLGTRTFNIR